MISMAFLYSPHGAEPHAGAIRRGGDRASLARLVWDNPFMCRRSSVGRLPTVTLAFYVACVALVCSFIFFEVLDIDGSDFPAAPVRAVTPPHPAEASHDIKRTHPGAAGPLWADVPPPVTAGVNLALRGQQVTRLAAASSSSQAARAFRPSLARSSLDHPASA